MLDTQTRTEDIVTDTPDGPHPRFTSTAIERAKTVLGITDLDGLGAALGFSRMNFWRARRGDYDPRLSHARRIARQLGMPLDQVFDGGSNA
jgi:DNA-binding XRE family transcriptional regulator